MKNVATRPRCGQSDPPFRAPSDFCRLSLTINGTPYHVRPTPPAAFAALKSFALRRDDGTHCHVSQTLSGPACDCPDAASRSRDGASRPPCEHVRALTAAGLLTEGPCLPPGGAGNPGPLADQTDRQAAAYRAWDSPLGRTLRPHDGRTRPQGPDDRGHHPRRVRGPHRSPRRRRPGAVGGPGLRARPPGRLPLRRELPRLSVDRHQTPSSTRGRAVVRARSRTFSWLEVSFR